MEKQITQKSRLKKVQEYYDHFDYQGSLNRNDYFSIGQYGFINKREIDGKEHNMFDSYHDIATLVILSSFNKKDFESEFLSTFQVNPLMIALRFGFKNQSKNLAKVIKSIENLKNNNVIKIIDTETGKRWDDNKEINKNSLMTIHQDLKWERISNQQNSNTTTRVYSSMLNEYLDRIVNGSKHSDDEKFRLLATYATLSTRMNASKDIDSYTHVDLHNNILNAMQVVNVESHLRASIASCQSARTFDKYADMLCELKVLFRVGVVRSNSENYKKSYYYSKYHQARILKIFVDSIILTQAPEGYEYLNIFDIVPFGEEIQDDEFDDTELDLDARFTKDCNGKYVLESATERPQEVVSKSISIQSDDCATGSVGDLKDDFEVLVDGEELEVDREITRKAIEVIKQDKVISIEEKMKEKIKEFDDVEFDWADIL